MNAIRVRKKLESDTLHLPELQAFIGKEVEIVVSETPAIPLVSPGTGDFEDMDALVEEIRAHYDFDAVRKQREYDLLHVFDHLP